MPPPPGASRRRGRRGAAGRPGGRCSPRSESQRAASRPRTTAAVDAVLASTQVGAATVALRHTGAAGAAVRGSTMWCRRTPPRRQVRRTVEDVATAEPGRQGDLARRGRRRGPGPHLPAAVGRRARRWRCRRRARPGRRRRACRPRGAASRSAARALAVAPRSSWTSRGQLEPVAVQVDPAPAGHWLDQRAPAGRRRAAARCCGRSRAARIAPPTVGSTRPSLRLGGVQRRRRPGRPASGRAGRRPGGRRAGELGVAAEPRAGMVDFVQAGPDDAGRRSERVWVGHHDRPVVVQTSKS